MSPAAAILVNVTTTSAPGRMPCGLRRWSTGEARPWPGPVPVVSSPSHLGVDTLGRQAYRNGMDTFLLAIAAVAAISIVATLPSVARQALDERHRKTTAAKARRSVGQLPPRPTHRDDEADQRVAEFMATVTGEIYPEDHPVTLHAEARRQLDGALAETRALTARVVELERELAKAQRSLRFRPPADPIVQELATDGPLSFDALRFRFAGTQERDLNGRLAHLMIRTGQVERLDQHDGTVLFAYIDPAAALVAV